MPFRSLDLPWISQPPGRVGIDPTHPLASKIAFAYYGGNIASHISATTGAVRYAGPYGAAATVTATGITAQQADVSRTVFILCRNTPASQIIRAGAGGASGWAMAIPAGNQTPVWTDYGVADYTLPILWTAANQWQAFAVRRDRGSANDVRLFNSSGAQVGSAVAGGSYNAGSYEYTLIGTPVSLLVVVEDALSQDAIREYLANPWQLFEPEPITIYWPAAAGGGEHATSGAILGGGSLIDGAAARTRLHAANGDLYGLGATLGGSAARLALHITSGVLIGSSAILDGIAARTRAHPASGDLIGGGAIITGDLVRSEIPEHFTSGAILGDGASVSGSAARFRAFDTSGDIVGAGAVVDGAADKTGPAEHAASGSFVGGGSVVDGQASRYRALGTSGDIEGDGAAVVGIAAIIRTHDASGSLFGDGALITGVVIRGGQVELLHVVVTARAAFACVVSARAANNCTVSEAIAA